MPLEVHRWPEVTSKRAWFIAQRVESTKEASMHSWLVDDWKQYFSTWLAQKSGPVRLRKHEHEPMADRSLWLVAWNTDGHDRTTMITGQLQPFPSQRCLMMSWITETWNRWELVDLWLSGAKHISIRKSAGQLDQERWLEFFPLEPSLK